MFSSIDVSASALIAQRTRMTATASNLANISTTRDEYGNVAPYRRRFVLFQTDESIGSNGAAGVKVPEVVISDQEPIYKYDPTNPLAIKEGEHEGYVAMPNVDMMVEMTNAMEAARSYEASLGAMEITKDMIGQSLRIIA